MAVAASSSSTRDHLLPVREITKCSICFDECKNPKSLPCLHSFCLHCLQQLWGDNRPGDKVPCPVCRTVLTIPRRGLAELPCNFVIQSLIDFLERSSKQACKALCESCEKNSDENGDIPPATTYCVDCDQKLCKPCSKPHKAMKGRPHEVGDLEDESIMRKIEEQENYVVRPGEAKASGAVARYLPPIPPSSPSAATLAAQRLALIPPDTTPWYAGEISREVAELLLRYRSNGTFLVRLSTGINPSLHGEFVLSVKYNDVLHAMIQPLPDGRVCLKKDVTFGSILDLVEYYHVNSLLSVYRELGTALHYPFKQPEALTA